MHWRIISHCTFFIRSEPSPGGPIKSCGASSTKSLGENEVKSKIPDRATSKTSVTSAGSSDSPYRTSEFYIIRVSIEESGPETEGESVFPVLKTELGILFVLNSRRDYVQKYYDRQPRANQRGYSQRDDEARPRRLSGELHPLTVPAQWR